MNKSISKANKLLEECYADQTLSYTTSKVWHKLFEVNGFDINNKSDSGYPEN